MQFGVGLAQRSIAQTRLHVPANKQPLHHGVVQDHLSTLTTTMELLASLTRYAPLLDRSRPTLWHTDLHMGNIFVSQEDNTQIVGLIDWQSTSISPLFLQVRWPVFLKPPEEYPEGPELPKLPANFEELDPNDKEMALFLKKRATCAKAYEIATYLNNRDAYNAKWELDDLLREFFVRVGDTWNDGFIPLRTCLIRIFEKWEEMGFPGPCPIQFTPAEIASHEQLLSEYTQWYEIQDFAMEYLDTDADGWLPPGTDWEKKQSQNKALMDLMVERLEGRKTRDELRQMWPFPTS